MAYLSTQQNMATKDNFSSIHTTSTQDGEIKGKVKIRPRVLLVEDNKIIQKVNLTILDNILHCDVTLAENGFKAVSVFEQAKESYQLIILDIGLPDISGVDVAKHIRQIEYDRQTRIRTPIIALTAFGENVHTQCIEAGMDDLYTKPLLIEGIEAMLKQWVPANNSCNH